VYIVLNFQAKRLAIQRLNGYEMSTATHQLEDDLSPASECGG